MAFLVSLETGMMIHFEATWLLVGHRRCHWMIYQGPIGNLFPHVEFLQKPSLLTRFPRVKLI